MRESTSSRASPTPHQPRRCIAILAVYAPVPRPAVLAGGTQSSASERLAPGGRRGLRPSKKRATTKRILEATARMAVPRRCIAILAVYAPVPRPAVLAGGTLSSASERLAPGGRRGLRPSKKRATTKGSAASAKEDGLHRQLSCRSAVREKNPRTIMLVLKMEV